MTDDVVADLDAELALIEELPYRVPIHLLAKRARDELVELRERLESILKEYDQADHRMQKYDAFENALDRARAALGWHYDKKTDEWMQRRRDPRAEG